MNYRIEELARRHAFRNRSVSGDKNDRFEFEPDQLEAFAKSIVKECMAICDAVYDDQYIEPIDRFNQSYFRMGKRFEIEGAKNEPPAPVPGYGYISSYGASFYD